MKQKTCKKSYRKFLIKKKEKRNKQEQGSKKDI